LRSIVASLSFPSDVAKPPDDLDLDLGQKERREGALQVAEE